MERPQGKTNLSILIGDASEIITFEFVSFQVEGSPKLFSQMITVLFFKPGLRLFFLPQMHTFFSLCWPCGSSTSCLHWNILMIPPAMSSQPVALCGPGLCPGGVAHGSFTKYCWYSDHLIYKAIDIQQVLYEGPLLVFFVVFVFWTSRQGEAFLFNNLPLVSFPTLSIIFSASRIATPPVGCKKRRGRGLFRGLGKWFLKRWRRNQACPIGEQALLLSSKPHPVSSPTLPDNCPSQNDHFIYKQMEEWVGKDQST